MTLYREHVTVYRDDREGVPLWVFSFSQWSIWKAALCEFLGTFLLVFVGNAPLVSAHQSLSPDDSSNMLAGLSLAAVVVTLVHIIGPSSGCNINPCVTLALTLNSRLHPFKATLYFIAQLTGGVAGAAALYWVSPSDWVSQSQLGLTDVHSRVSWAQAVAMESIVTLMLVLLVLVISDPHSDTPFEGFPALSSGVAILACVYAAGPYTGASLNPARSFGPALVMLSFEHQWIYWAGPLGGTLMACGIYRLLLAHPNTNWDPSSSGGKSEEGAGNEQMMSLQPRTRAEA